MSFILENPLYEVNFLTLQTTFTFAQVVAQDGFVDVLHVLIYIIARLIVTVLLIDTRREKNNQHCTNRKHWIKVESRVFENSP